MLVDLLLCVCVQLPADTAPAPGVSVCACLCLCLLCAGASVEEIFSMVTKTVLSKRLQATMDAALAAAQAQGGGNTVPLRHAGRPRQSCSKC